uniref:Uncharacterized protein n=1 Tax=Octopus bimaculoides TaxID=37653 RepID=A0A0L8GRI1_OCTBM
MDDEVRWYKLRDYVDSYSFKLEVSEFRIPFLNMSIHISRYRCVLCRPFRTIFPRKNFFFLGSIQRVSCSLLVILVSRLTSRH